MAKIRAKKVQAAEQAAIKAKRQKEKEEAEAQGLVWTPPKIGGQFKDDDIQSFLKHTKEVMEVLEHVQDIQITHPSFYVTNKNIKTADKFLAVAAYLVFGNSRLASKFMGGRVKPGTIRKWKHDNTWYPEVEQAIKKSQGWKWDAKATSIIDKASDAILERLEKGDEVITAKGETLHRAVSAKDAASVLTQTFNTRALQRGDPTSRSEKSATSDDRLKKLEQAFRDMGAQAKPIEGEVVIEKDTKDA